MLHGVMNETIIINNYLYSSDRAVTLGVTRYDNYLT